MEKKRLELNNETKRMIRRAAGRRFSLQLEKLIQQKKVHEENLKITDEYYQIVKGKMKEVQNELANVFEGFRVSNIYYFMLSLMDQLHVYTAPNKLRAFVPLIYGKILLCTSVKAKSNAYLCTLQTWS